MPRHGVPLPLLLAVRLWLHLWHFQPYGTAAQPFARSRVTVLERDPERLDRGGSELLAGLG